MKLFNRDVRCLLGHFPWSPPWMHSRDVTCRRCGDLLITAEETDYLVALDDRLSQAQASQINRMFGIEASRNPNTGG